MGSRNARSGEGKASAFGIVTVKYHLASQVRRRNLTWAQEMKIEEIRARAEEAWAVVEQMQEDHPLRDIAMQKARELDDLVSRRELEE